MLVLFLCAGSFAAGLRGQSQTGPPTGLLMGAIVDALDGRPVPNVQVTLGGAPTTVRNPIVLTDSEGQFVFMDLPKGTYTITATKSGYTDGALGRRRPQGLAQSVTLVDAERIANLSIPIWKHAVITGRVTDEGAEPMIGVSVTVFHRTVVAGHRKLLPAATARTDDRGVYRAASLVTGDYVVAVASTQAAAPESVIDLHRQYRFAALKPGESDISRDISSSGISGALNMFMGNVGDRVGTVTFMSTGGGVRVPVPPRNTGTGRIHVYPTQYFPSAPTAAGASVITVRSGEERAAVDVQLKLSATSQVSGTVTGPNGPAMVALGLVPETDDLASDFGFETATTVSDAAGRFTFVGVPPGRYQLRGAWVQVPVGVAGSRGAAAPRQQTGETPKPAPLPSLGGFTLWVAQTLVVGDTEITNLTITVRNGYRFSGRAEFAGTAKPPTPEQLRRMSATFDPADARPLVSATIGRGQFDDNGQLSSYQLPPGRYYVRINNPPPGWTLKSATYGGRDLSNVPVLLDRDIAGISISFTDRPSSVAGQVMNASGQPDASATVLVFPADSAAWTDTGALPHRLRSIRVDRNGRYQTAGLPNGDYIAVAIPEEASADWQDPTVLRALARVGSTVTIGDGDSRSLALKTTVR